MLPFKRIAAIKLPYASLLGGLTYPLYLIHARFGYLVMSRYGEDSNKWLVVVLLIITVLIVSFIMLDIDKMLNKFWTGTLDSSLGEAIRRFERRKIMV
ncbi:MAG: hypothetical protein ABFS02_14205 [Pseudomonadota bacterium]